MLRLDYISCVLTILSTVLVGRKLWHGWIFAGVNSALICVIGVRTAQFGFIPANVFCIALYSYNLWTWRRCPRQVGAAQVTGPATRIKLRAEAVASYQPSLVETADCTRTGMGTPIDNCPPPAIQNSIRIFSSGSSTLIVWPFR